MPQQLDHAMLPRATHDEAARQAFVQSLKLHLATRVVQGNREVYEGHARPAFERLHGRPPADRREVAEVMEDEPFYQLWGSLQRCSQELCWASVLDSIERQCDELATRARPRAGARGSLTLDDTVEVPRYLSAVDIHCMPGGYAGEAIDDDVTAGALYDRGGYIYAMGGWGADNGAMGRTGVEVLRAQFPDFTPTRILDLGCGIGHSTLPWAEAFPDAELHGVDVAAPMLRYGHARAEALGVPVQFRQADATALPYADDSFDLVLSHILLHETSGSAIRRVLAECFRVLRPGGVTLHVELSLYDGMAPFDAFMLSWDTRHNNEPFWSTFRALDPVSLMTGAGFPPDDVHCARVSRSVKAAHVFSDRRDAGGRKFWEVLAARKPAAA